MALGRCEAGRSADGDGQMNINDLYEKNGQTVFSRYIAGEPVRELVRYRWDGERFVPEVIDEKRAEIKRDK